jgi:hypothetical protein
MEPFGVAAILSASGDVVSLNQNLRINVSMYRNVVKQVGCGF